MRHDIKIAVKDMVDMVAIDGLQGGTGAAPEVVLAEPSLAADRYVQERREILAELSASGVVTLDVTARDFPVALANRYHDLKADGRL